jgi:hypothetical protein
VETQLKKEGLSKNSGQKFLEKLSTLDIETQISKNFIENVMYYLKVESSQINQDESVLASSDIIESIYFWEI